MTIYRKLKGLLADIEPLLEAVEVTAQKWVEVSPSHREFRAFRDKSGEAALAYGRVLHRIRKLESYSACKVAFDEDPTFSFAGFLAGYWGSFDAILQDMVLSSARISRSDFSIDYRKAYRRFRQLRRDFSQSKFRYEARVRLYGVKLRPKKLHLGQRILLYRLNRKERNDLQPVVQPYLPGGFHETFASSQPTEARLPIEVPVNRSDKNAYFDAHNSAESIARGEFQNLTDAIRLVKPGEIAIGPLELSGGFSQMGIGRSLDQRMPPHARVSVATSDRRDIIRAYNLVSGGEGSDDVLTRSLHRFLLGRTRQSVRDRIVDYVIGWEILLLTIKGSPQKQELSYRFSVNGASVASAANRNLDRQQTFDKMRSAYATRSVLLHGSAKDDLKGSLSKGEFKSTHKLSEFLETRYREVVFWLASIPVGSRPYLQVDGWHQLLWPD